jgi:hypothetical protein
MQLLLLVVILPLKEEKLLLLSGCSLSDLLHDACRIPRSNFHKSILLGLAAVSWLTTIFYRSIVGEKGRLVLLLLLLLMMMMLLLLLLPTLRLLLLERINGRRSTS